MNVALQRAVLGAILLISIFLRFGDLDWGIRSLETFRLDGEAVAVNHAGFNPDADALYDAGKSLNTRYWPVLEIAGRPYQFNSYGTLYLYLNRVLAKVGGVVLGFEPFGESARDGNLTRISGRWVSALAGVALVWVTWLVGLRVFGQAGALGSSLLAAVLPMSVQAAHLATVDGLLGLWFAAAIWSSLCVLAEGRLRDFVLCGLFIGLATATKINGLFLLLPLGLAHLLRQPDALSFAAFRKALTSRALYVSVAIGTLTWIVLTPAAVFEYAEFFAPRIGGPYHIQHSLLKASESAATHRGWLYLDGVSTYLYHPFHVFPLGFGWVVQIAALVGLVFACFRRSPALVILAVSFAVYYLLIARLPDKPIRFFVPMSTLIAILAPYPIVELLKKQRIYIMGVALVCLVVEPAIRSSALASVYGRPDNRVAAAKWIQTNIAFAGKLMLERGHNSLEPLVNHKQVSLLMADLEHELGNSRGDMLALRGHYSAALEAEFLSQVDYFAISDERIALRRVRPAAKDFYERLFAGELGFELRETFSSRPEFLGIPLENDWTDLNWSRYDHPTTYVFQRATQDPSLYTEHPDLAIYRLRSPEDTNKVIRLALKEKSYTIFKRCLSGKYKEKVGEEALVDQFMAFLKDPSTLIGASGQMTLIRDGKAWRIKVE